MSDPAPTAVVELNEAQERVVRELGATAEQRPVFPDGLAAGLRERLTTGLGDKRILIMGNHGVMAVGESIVTLTASDGAINR